MSPERTAFISSFGLGTRPHLASFAMGLRNHHGRPNRPTAFRSSREGGRSLVFRDGRPPVRPVFSPDKRIDRHGGQPLTRGRRARPGPDDASNARVTLSRNFRRWVPGSAIHIVESGVAAPETVVANARALVGSPSVFALCSRAQ